MVMNNIKKTIAKAIKRADKSYFFENYTKQANAVLQTLHKQGYTIVPIEPTKQMLQTGTDQIQSGSVRPQALVERIYKAMVQQ